MVLHLLNDCLISLNHLSPEVKQISQHLYQSFRLALYGKTLFQMYEPCKQNEGIIYIEKVELEAVDL